MNLYEFYLEKIYLSGGSREFTYQVPANTSEEAHLVIGQTFYDVDRYTLIVHSWNKV